MNGEITVPKGRERERILGSIFPRRLPITPWAGVPYHTVRLAEETTVGGVVVLSGVDFSTRNVDSLLAEWNDSDKAS